MLVDQGRSREDGTGVVAALGVLGVRFGAKKSFYLLSKAAMALEGKGAGDKPDPLFVKMLNANGEWRNTSITAVPPQGDADGETTAERGAARYLGAYFSFEGVDGEPWAEQDTYMKRTVSSFFNRLALFDPDPGRGG